MDPADHQGIRAGNPFGPGLTGGADRWTGTFPENNDPLPIIAASKSIFRQKNTKEPVRKWNDGKPNQQQRSKPDDFRIDL